MASLFAVEALVFDAYGTLFDVQAQHQLTEALFPGHGAELSGLWRRKQLEYTWLLSLMGQYRPFSEVTRAALEYSVQMLGFVLGPSEEMLMDAYNRLPVFPEVPAALSRLSRYRLAVLSNGTPQMLHSVVEHNRLQDWLEPILSVEAVRTYKPHPRAYQMALDALGLRPQQIGFVSANGWDAAGAKAFGFKVCWLNRSALPQETHAAGADVVVGSLEELAEMI
jgi:2-haloacid dehalogenase